MLEVLADRTYRHLFGAQVIALLGTGLATVALGLLAYDLAGSNLMLELGCAALRTPLGRRAARKIFFGNGSFPDVPPAPRATPLGQPASRAAGR